MKNEKVDIVKQFIEYISNADNNDDLTEFISPHYTEVFNNKRYRLGIRGIQKKIAGIREVYPDLKLSIDMQVTEGEWVATSYVMNGTQLGSWKGVQPTGKPIEIRGVNIDRVVDGKITEHGSNADLLDPLLETSQRSPNWVKDNLQEKFAA